jgi:uncharacterized membrane protein YphA (DoxX/SURF4 family)
MNGIYDFTDLKKHSHTGFRFLMTGLRILIGWHFLYEGISKAFATNLLESHWLFSEVFHWMATTPAVLKIVDLLNIWGLIFIGLGLFFGIFTRLASTAGALVLFLYYLANPPFIGFISETTGEGYYFIVNKNFIEMAILVLFAVLPQHVFYSLDRLYRRIFQIPEYSEEGKILNNKNEARREFLKDLVSLPLFAGFVYGVFRKRQWESFEELNIVSQPSRTDATTGASPKVNSFASLSELTAQVPSGKIGEIKISRLLCGGNLISGYAHSRDLIYVSSLVQNYFTDEKVMETMRLCEACGINTIILRVDKNTLRVMEKYRRRNGKIQWIAQIKITEDNIRSDIDGAVDNGAIATYIHGGIADNFVAQGKVELLHKTLEYIKQRKVLAGLAGHDLNVMITSEKEGLDPDFYMKTLNSGNYWTAGPRLINKPDWIPDPSNIVEPEYMKNDHDNIWATTPQQTVEFMKQVKKPWIAYKALGAGAIRPKQGLKYVFENGADFVCLGMFDFQIVEDVNFLNEVLNSEQKRKRPWMA